MQLFWREPKRCKFSSRSQTTDLIWPLLAAPDNLDLRFPSNRSAAFSRCANLEMQRLGSRETMRIMPVEAAPKSAST